MSEPTHTHTPGPWKVYGTWVHPVLEDGSNSNESHAICACHGPDLLPNARLVSAAPEMAEALSAFLSAYREYRMAPDGSWGRGDASTQLEDAYDRARAALAKSRGETP